MEKVKRRFTQTKRFRWTMSFCIRMAETALLGFIPSVVSVLLLFLTPNARVWAVTSGLAYVVFLAGSCFFWLDYMVKKMNVLEFYIVNVTVLVIYSACSWLMALFADAMDYSWFFANMRFFENLTVFIPDLEIKTRFSIIISNSIALGLMILTERLSHIKIRKMLAAIEASKPLEAETDEHIVVDDSAPSQNDEEIAFLSVEEMEKAIMEDAKESQSVLESITHGRKNSDVLDGGEMTQGRGRKVRRVDYSQMSEEEILMDNVKEEDTSLDDYDSGSLWNTEQYKDRIGVDSDEPPVFMTLPEDDGEDEGLWNTEALEGRDRLRRSQVRKEENDFNISSDNDNYESSSLWSGDFYKENKKRMGSDEEDTDAITAANVHEDYDSDSLWNIESKQLEEE